MLMMQGARGKVVMMGSTAVEALAVNQDSRLRKRRSVKGVHQKISKGRPERNGIIYMMRYLLNLSTQRSSKRV